jgi:hypothetical protein
MVGRCWSFKPSECQTTSFSAARGYVRICCTCRLQLHEFRLLWASALCWAMMASLLFRQAQHRSPGGSWVRLVVVEHVQPCRLDALPELLRARQDRVRGAVTVGGAHLRRWAPPPPPPPPQEQRERRVARNSKMGRAHTHRWRRAPGSCRCGTCSRGPAPTLDTTQRS